MNRTKWIYDVRALAIVAVVVCHQQTLLHMSEWIQFATLYSVTLLIYLAGVTNALWIKKSQSIFIDQKVMHVMVKKIHPIICSYMVATLVYMIAEGTMDGWNHFFTSLLSFDVSGPFYFVEYYIFLTLISPLIYLVISKVSNADGKIGMLCNVLCVALFFVIGYFAVGRIYLGGGGGSYLGIYAAGMVFGYAGAQFEHHKRNICLGSMILIIGAWSSKIFYWNRVNGYFEPVGIDVLVPKLGLNPPNLSVILYAAGVLMVVGNLSDLLREKEKGKLCGWVVTVIEQIGRYSLDIFLWHMLIQKVLKEKAMFGNIYIRNIVWYLCMIGLPITGRCLYKKIKEEMYRELRKS